MNLRKSKCLVISKKDSKGCRIDITMIFHPKKGEGLCFSFCISRSPSWSPMIHMRSICKSSFKTSIFIVSFLDVRFQHLRGLRRGSVNSSFFFTVKRYAISFTSITKLFKQHQNWFLHLISKCLNVFFRKSARHFGFKNHCHIYPTSLKNLGLRKSKCLAVFRKKKRLGTLK